jgi:hypothetical protein
VSLTNLITRIPVPDPNCAVCGGPCHMVEGATWFFIGGPKECVHVCSRDCLVQWATKRFLEKDNQCPTIPTPIASPS